MTQTEAILALLREQGEEGVTPMLALEAAGCFRLAARIADLRDAGYPIASERYTTPTGKVVARYVLRERTFVQVPLW